MRKIPATLALTALALAIPAALAQQASGSVSLTGYATDVNGDNPFRLFEYRDLSDGVAVGADVRFGSQAWWHHLFAENLGRDDQFAQLRGGRYGLFKYTVYIDDIVHNLTYNAITPFTGIGSNSLSFGGAAPSTDTATWSAFDYGIQHRNVGGLIEAQAGVDSPFYVRFGSNRKRTDGLRPIGGSGGSPGGPTYELQAPVDWTTTDFTGEAGYSTKNVHYSVSALYSKFEDHNEFLNWRHPLVTTGSSTEWSTLAPSSEMWRIAGNAMWKRLPLDSSLALRATYAKYTSDSPVQTSWLSVSGTNGLVRLANPSSPEFDGEVVSKSFSAALNSNPAARFDTRLYWNWVKRDNDTHHIVFTPSGPGSGGACDFSATGTALTTCTTEFLHFTRNNVGAELRWRVNRDNRLTFGIDYTDIERERIDYDRTEETKATLEWKSGWLGFADTRVKYQRMKRDSDFLLGERTDPFARDLHRFDAAPVDRDLLKLSFDFTPAPMLDLGAEVIFKRNEYRDTILGRTADRREELYLSASWGDMQVFRVTAFFDYERTRYESNHWVGSTATYPVPNTAGTAYMWQGNVKDKNHLVGLAADWPVNSRLRIVGAATYQKTDGTVDFVSQNNLGNPVPIDAYDSFTKKMVNVKATYGLLKNVDVSLGAAYEKYDFNDVQMDGYIHAVRTGTTQNLLSGAYAFASYRASIVYATVTYRF